MTSTTLMLFSCKLNRTKMSYHIQSVRACITNLSVEHPVMNIHLDGDSVSRSIPEMKTMSKSQTNFTIVHHNASTRAYVSVACIFFSFQVYRRGSSEVSFYNPPLRESISESDVSSKADEATFWPLVVNKISVLSGMCFNAITHAGRRTCIPDNTYAFYIVKLFI